MLIEYRETSNYGTALDSAGVSYKEAQAWRDEDILGYAIRFDEVNDRIGWDLHAELVKRFKGGEKSLSPTLMIALMRATKPDLYAVNPADADSEGKREIMALIRKMNVRFDKMERERRLMTNALGVSGDITDEAQDWMRENGVSAEGVGIEPVGKSAVIPIDQMQKLRDANAEARNDS